MCYQNLKKHQQFTLSNDFVQALSVKSSNKSSQKPGTLAYIVFHTTSTHHIFSYLWFYNACWCNLMA